MRCIRIRSLLLAMLILRAAFIAPAQTVPPGKSTKLQENLPSSLSREIQHQLWTLPYYSVFDSINFTLEGKKVTLTGQVLRHSLKDSAEAAVKNLDGVDVVVNQIEVLPASPSDDDLRRAVYRALYEDHTLERYATQPVPPIHIIVKDGNVALEGFVESLADKNLAANRASTVAKILSLKNNLVVRPKGAARE